MLDRHDAEIPHADRILDLFLRPEVTDEYTIDRSMTPDLDGARSFVTGTWEIPEEEIASSFDRLERSLDGS